MSKIIGIDLGTGNSCVSVYEGNEVKVIPNAEGKRTTPSIVFIKDGEIKVGDSAKRSSVVNPQNTIYSIKRLMGKSYDQVKDMKLPYKVINDGGRPAVEIDGKKYSPEEISAMIIQKMKKTAEDYLGEKVEKAVITVPAYWGNDEKKATKIAGEIAGLTVERIVNEPTAAALAYGIDKKGSGKKILVFDEGSGTHDISVIDFEDGVFEVLATDGDPNLGGDDIDDILIEWLSEEFKKDTNVDLRKDPMALQRLKDAAEKAKIELSSTTSTDINLPYISVVDGVPQHLIRTLTKSEFERLIDGFIKKSIDPITRCLNKANIKKSEIEEVILIGGTTRIPIIQDEVSKYFDGKKLNKSINPDEGVSIGATINGGIISGQNTDILLLDVIPISIGIETMGGVFTKLVEANTTIPTQKSEIFSTSQDGQTTVTVHVLQGERPMAKDNKSLGRFNLDNIPPAQRGVPQLEITLDIDVNGILNVKAKDKSTGKENSIRIEGSSKLSDDEIARMKAEAEANAESDRKEKEIVDKLNEADSLIFQTEKSLKEYGDKMSDEDKDRLKSSIESLRKSHSDKNIESIDTNIKLVQDIWSEIGTKMHQSSNDNNTSNVNNSGDGSEDIDFEEVN